MLHTGFKKYAVGIVFFKSVTNSVKRLDMYSYVVIFIAALFLGDVYMLRFYDVEKSLLWLYCCMLWFCIAVY